MNQIKQSNHAQADFVHPLMRVSIADLRARISRARSMDLARLSDEQVFQRIARLVDGYTKRQDQLQTNMLFRARRNESGEPFQRASELWYPPSSIVTRGRFNSAGEAVFYISNRFHAAIFEMRPSVGDLFTVLAVHRRNFSQPITCLSVGMSRCKAPEAMLGGRHLRWDSPFPPGVAPQRRVKARWSAIDNYLGDICLAPCPPNEEDQFYKPTNAISRLFSGIPSIDALQYPSVAVDLNAINLRLTTQKADELFQPGEAWMVEVIDHQDDVPGLPALASGYFQMHLLARTSTIDDDGMLDWKPFNNGDPVPRYIDGSPRYPLPD